jgi:hypothetical protein
MTVYLASISSPLRNVLIIASYTYSIYHFVRPDNHKNRFFSKGQGSIMSSLHHAIRQVA